MSPIPRAVRAILDANPWMHRCCRKDGYCSGRVTWEHSLKWQGRQLQTWWAIIPLCEFHHLGKGLDKRWNEWVALSRAPAGELAKYRGSGWEQKLSWLEKTYGKWRP